MSDKKNGGFLVYVRRLGRPTPQWWPELYYGERGDRRKSVIAIFPLDETEANLSLDELVARYPLEEGDKGSGTGGAHG